jgi:hypothetical protein
MKRGCTSPLAVLQPLNSGALVSLLPVEFARIASAQPSVLALSPSQRLVFANPSISVGSQGTAAAQVLAAELEGRQGHGEALSLMVSTIASMVQAGRSTPSRWNAG